MGQLFVGVPPGPQSRFKNWPLPPALAGLSVVCYRDHKTLCGLSKAGKVMPSRRCAKTGVETVDLEYNIQRKNLKQEAVA